MMLRSTAVRRRCLAVLVALLLMGATACGAGSGGGGAVHKGGTFVAGMFAEMDSFDPVAVTYPGVGMERAAAVMGTLMAVDDRSGKVSPYMAKSMTSANGGRVWTLKLRPNVKFSDGEPYNADAVLFNLKRHTSNDSTSLAKPYLANLSFKKVDDLTIRITSSKPDGTVPLYFTSNTPAGLVGAPKALADPKKFATHPVGAGPFILQSWQRDNEMQLKANPNYWDKGKPYVDKLVFRVLPDESARTNAAISGDVNWTSVQRSSLPQVQSGNAGTKVWDKEVVGGTALLMNNASGPTSDIRVRKAIWKAFDPKVTAKVEYKGEWDGDLNCVPFGKASPDCLDGVHPEYDEAGAKALIADYLSDGGDPKITILVGQGTNNSAYYQERLNAIGLDAKIETVDTADLTTRTISGDYQIFVAGTAQMAYPAYWIRLKSDSPNRWVRKPVPGLDKAVDAVQTASTAKERSAAWDTVQQIVADDALVVWTSSYSLIAVSNNAAMAAERDTAYRGSTMVYFDSVKVSD